MVQKAKILYFTVFILAVVAFIFHVNAMGHHRWKQANRRNYTVPYSNRTTFGLFTRCEPTTFFYTETCFPNKYPAIESNCSWTDCLSKSSPDYCRCDFLPSTKGIAACTIIAAIFLGIAIILLFIHSIKTTETRAIGLFLSFLPLILLLLAFIFILIALILVGSYLSREIMHIVRANSGELWGDVRLRAENIYEIRIDWSSGLEIIALVFTFFSFILYSLFVFKLGRSS